MIAQNVSTGGSTTAAPKENLLTVLRQLRKHRKKLQSSILKAFTLKKQFDVRVLPETRCDCPEEERSGLEPNGTERAQFEITTNSYENNEQKMHRHYTTKNRDKIFSREIGRLKIPGTLLSPKLSSNGKLVQECDIKVVSLCNSDSLEGRSSCQDGNFLENIRIEIADKWPHKYKSWPNDSIGKQTELKAPPLSSRAQLSLAKIILSPKRKYQGTVMDKEKIHVHLGNRSYSQGRGGSLINEGTMEETNIEITPATPRVVGMKFWHDAKSIAQVLPRKVISSPRAAVRLCGSVTSPSSTHLNWPTKINSRTNGTILQKDAWSWQQECDTEEMHIELNAYSLHGIICRKHPSRKNKKKRNKSFSNYSAPITAVLAVQRRPTSSENAPNTFLPSLPLNKMFDNSHDDNNQRCIAHWFDARDNLIKNIRPDDAYPTLKFTRMMRREPYRANMMAQQMSHYVHERIDLQIYVGKGKELIPLGVASIMVSGEEEKETVVNAPVKPIKKFGSEISSIGPLHTKNCLVEGCEVQSYELEENATLKVGVKVIPNQLVLDAQFLSEQSSISVAIANKESKIIELDDDKNLIQDYIESNCISESSSQMSQASFHAPDMHPSLGDFFCGVLNVCGNDHIESKSGCSPHSDILLRQQTSKKTEAVVIPLAQLSDVSESTDGSIDESMEQ
jgi:hypothetical protein